MHSLGLARIVSSVPGFTARPNKRKVQFSHTPGEAAAGPRQGRGHCAASTTAFPPQRGVTVSTFPIAHGAERRPSLLTWTTLLADAILLPIMTPEKGQLPGRWRAAVLTGVPRGSGRALPVASRRRSGRRRRTLLHCGANPTPWRLTPPRLSSRWGADPRVSRWFRFAGEDLWCWIYFVHQPMSDLGPFLLRIVSF